MELTEIQKKLLKAKAYGEAGGTFYKKSNETKESEDERIRKNCIHFLELQKSHHASTVEIEECIAWLEKQGDYNGLVEKAKAYNEAHMQDVRERAAIAALSGTLSDPNTVGNFEQFADVAVGYADALIERLKKK